MQSAACLFFLHCLLRVPSHQGRRVSAFLCVQTPLKGSRTPQTLGERLGMRGRGVMGGMDMMVKVFFLTSYNNCIFFRL